uniref:Retrotransposon protein, putative, Ty3-gypsy subclass n=1 Tax=Oryza sativa subsp. japonica TaxID=39947 RepID=Q7XED6_ORYSJ|nr:retrotransposon protein, putative, Ty3-gypsy subclass [Oryza sativa Japonica Group]
MDGGRRPSSPELVVTIRERGSTPERWDGQEEVSHRVGFAGGRPATTNRGGARRRREKGGNFTGATGVRFKRMGASPGFKEFISGVGWGRATPWRSGDERRPPGAGADGGKAMASGSGAWGGAYEPRELKEEEGERGRGTEGYRVGTGHRDERRRRGRQALQPRAGEGEGEEWPESASAPRAHAGFTSTRDGGGRRGRRQHGGDGGPAAMALWEETRGNEWEVETLRGGARIRSRGFREESRETQGKDSRWEFDIFRKWGQMANLADYFNLGPQIHRSLYDVRMNLDVLKCCSTVLFLEDNFPELLSGGFLNPNDISLEFIQVSISFSSCLGKRSLTSGLRTNSLPYQFEWSLCIEHNDNPLQLRCIGLRVRYEVYLYQDSEGRPNKLSIVVDIPENLRQVLEFCDEIAEITFRKFGSNSEWRQVIKEYGNRPSVRLNIPIVGSGDDATYATEIYLKEASGNIRKKDFSKADVAELEFMFFRGDMVDAFFSVELYDYKNNAGIRLVAKKLVVHCR